VVPLDVAPDPIVTTNVAHISIATHSVWGTLLINPLFAQRLQIVLTLCWNIAYQVAIDYRIVPGSFPNPVVSVGVCYSAVDAAAGAAGGLTTGWWAVVLECFSSHPLWYLWLEHILW